VAYKDVQRILIYNIIAAVGFLAFGLSVANQAALEGLVFYLIHDMIAKTLLFLLGGILIMVAGTSQLKKMGGLIGRYPLLGWMFLIAGLAIVGIPPLSGFVGKMLIVQGGLVGGHYVLTGIALLSSLLILYSMLQIFIRAFWGRERSEDDGVLSDVGVTNAIPSFMLAPSIVLFVLVILIGVGAEWVYAYVLPASKVLLDPQIYIDAVLDAPHGRL
jgi:multicomponent Na+:H+ antiporter subunit D